jgi:hypothetical protein
MKQKLLWTLLLVSTTVAALPLLPWITNEGPIGLGLTYLTP